MEPAKPLGTKDAPSIIEEALEKPVGGLFLKYVVKPGSIAGIVIDPIVPVIARDEAAKALRFRLTALGIDNVRVFMRKDRKSTRLNSSHQIISYAVFCLKKKKKKKNTK